MSDPNRLIEIYQSGRIPWDQPDPPPEVLRTAAQMPIGRALDLGCGFGRATLYLARLGWHVDGVDFIPQAIQEATRRAQAANLHTLAHFHVSPVTRLDFLTGPYEFALDVGCAHSLSTDELADYHAQLLHLLSPQATYLLFAHLSAPDDAENAHRWMDEANLRNLFAKGFCLSAVEYGQTQVNDQAPWPSAWFWFRRLPGSD